MGQTKVVNKEPWYRYTNQKIKTFARELNQELHKLLTQSGEPTPKVKEPKPKPTKPAPTPTVKPVPVAPAPAAPIPQDPQALTPEQQKELELARRDDVYQNPYIEQRGDGF